MRSKRLLTGTLLLLSALPALAQQLTLNPGARVVLAVSNTDPNAIRVNDDRIVAVQATQGVLTAKSPTPDGGVLFSTVSQKPFTLFVQTASGYSFSAQATPGKRPGLTLTVDNPAIRGTEEAARWEQTQTGYSGLVSTLVSRFVNNRLPAGYVYTKNTAMPVSDSVLQSFSLRPVSAWQGRSVRIVRTDITGITSQRIKLSERYFWSPGVMAVAFHPRLDVLEPGGRVSVIVLYRTKGEVSDEH
ncbi:TraK domain-containing protein [Erwinia typographi]|uniref:TraK domain-containing protein n=1 Tax=Erwinia typographi TaxID=371042 RepID=UPI00068E26B3|nr:type-F conjugative transfer system secretin TraK [Erwinia typographi]